MQIEIRYWKCAAIGPQTVDVKFFHVKNLYPPQCKVKGFIAWFALDGRPEATVHNAAMIPGLYNPVLNIVTFESKFNPPPADKGLIPRPLGRL